jgi:chloramphenicol 3-O phosphotransferase
MAVPGHFVVLNGVPRSGKSSIVSVIQRTFDGMWLNLGVDAFSGGITPEQFLPGIGLRPGGERPDLEPLLPILFDALCESVMAQSRLGLNVVMDVGLHDDYSTPLGILGRVSNHLRNESAFFIGVRCPIEVIMDRRGKADVGRYVRDEAQDGNGAIPEAVLRWERAVHTPGVYDCEVDTAALTPTECADAIRSRMDQGPPTAFRQVWERTRLP